MRTLLSLMRNLMTRDVSHLVWQYLTGLTETQAAQFDIFITYTEEASRLKLEWIDLSHMDGCILFEDEHEMVTPRMITNALKATPGGPTLYGWIQMRNLKSLQELESLMSPYFEIHWDRVMSQAVQRSLTEEETARIIFTAQEAKKSVRLAVHYFKTKRVEWEHVVRSYKLYSRQMFSLLRSLQVFP